jgi:type IV secretion system protein TrbL
MTTPAGSILPQSFFDGLSQLWGACAFLAASLVAIGLALRGATGGWDPFNIVRLLVRVLLIGLATLFLREWLMRLNDIVGAFSSMMNIDPTTVDTRFAQFIAGKTGANPGTSFWDVLWGTGSVGSAIAYALLWFFGWLAWAVQFLVRFVGDILLSVGWSLSPIFLSFFMFRPMENVGRKYILGLVALVCWPFGWVIAAVVTNAMLDAAASASLIPSAAAAGASTVLPALTVLLVATWMLLSSALAPYVTTKVLLMGGNPAAEFAHGLAGVGQSVVAGGFGAATAAATGGAAAGGVIAAAAGGALASGAESAARGGASARSSATVADGLSGLYRAQIRGRTADALEESATAQGRRAGAAEAMAAHFDEHAKRTSRANHETTIQEQPRSQDPNQAAQEIDENDNQS